MNNEPVAWINREEGSGSILDWDKDPYSEINIPLYTHPVKELTDEEIMEVHRQIMEDNKGQLPPYVEFARAILRKAQEADKIESLGTVNIGGVHFRNGKEVK